MSVIEVVGTAHIPFIKSKPNKTLMVTCHMKNTDITAAIATGSLLNATSL